MIRVGVIGLGVISRYYLPALAAHRDTVLTAVADLDPARTAGFGPDVAVHRDHHALLADQDVDAVVVNVPNHLHPSICRDALLAGRHVCCEKPLAIEPAPAAELTELAERNGLVLLTAFHRRYNRNLLDLARLVADREPPRRALLTYRERIEEHCGDDSWYLDAAQCGGGCLADNGPNALDTALALFGQVRVVGAELRRDSDGVDRQAVVRLAADSGCAVRVELDWSYPHGEDKRVVLEWDDGRRAEADLLAGFPGFKSSLNHEYDGVVADLADAVLGRRSRVDTGAVVAELVARAYRASGELVT